MASKAQIEANRKNAQKSTGPRSTDCTRFNGLKHGLRAEQVILPGEDKADFEAERRAWLDEWRPCTHTRAVLVERAAVASWKLRRATRVEAIRLFDTAAEAAHEFDLAQKERVECALHTLSWDTGASLAQLRCSAAGLDRLVALWEGLVQAASAPGGWHSRSKHHDRLLNLLGHPSGSDPQDLEDARTSLRLLDAYDPAAAAEFRAFCAEQVAELRMERTKFWDPAEFRRRTIELATAPTSKEAQLLHRYERAHEKSLYAAIRGFLTLERSGADLPGEPKSAAGFPGESLRAPDDGQAEAPPNEAGAHCPGQRGTSAERETAGESTANPSPSETCGELASVGAPAPSGVGPRRPATPPEPRNRPTGAAPGPEMAPERS